MTEYNAQLIPSPEESKNLLAKLRSTIKDKQLMAPMTLPEIRELTADFLQENEEFEPYFDWILVMTNNCLWETEIKGIPFDRRVLILPECLKHSTKCPAKHDEFGLVCESCGNCCIGELLDLAEDLGMVTIVAEGSTMVTELIKSGKVEAVIGVSCFEALEKAFPNMIEKAIPGMAIPTSAGCVDTTVDIELLKSLIKLPYIEENRQLSTAEIKTWTKSLFNTENLCPKKPSAVEKIAYTNLCADGKRWRPFLTAATYASLVEQAELTDDLAKIAVSVECFHKASLIHDDIEDDDNFRYGKPTLHTEIGTAAAINIGDFLIGEGYQFINNNELSSNLKMQLFNAAITAHRQLTIGQGMELEWMNNKHSLSQDEIIHIFELKTAPAFEVALLFGIISANAYSKSLAKIIHEFSKNLGIAYQIQDDIDDFHEVNERSGPSIVSLFAENGIDESKALFQSYREKCYNSLQPLKAARLRRLLLQIAGQILNDE